MYGGLSAYRPIGVGILDEKLESSDSDDAVVVPVKFLIFHHQPGIGHLNTLECGQTNLGDFEPTFQPTNQSLEAGKRLEFE